MMKHSRLLRKIDEAQELLCDLRTLVIHDLKEHQEFDVSDMIAMVHAQQKIGDNDDRPTTEQVMREGLKNGIFKR